MECAQGDQPVVFCMHQPSAALSGGGVLVVAGCVSVVSRWWWCSMQWCGTTTISIGNLNKLLSNRFIYRATHTFTFPKITVISQGCSPLLWNTRLFIPGVFFKSIKCSLQLVPQSFFHIQTNPAFEQPKNMYQNKNPFTKLIAQLLHQICSLCHENLWSLVLYM